MTLRATITGVIILSILAACATRKLISYRNDVAPVLEQKCLECHTPPSGPGYLNSRLDMQSYQSLLEGTAWGPVIRPGDSRHSTLNMLVEGRLDSSMRSPHPLTAEEVEILRLWVDQGAKNN